MRTESKMICKKGEREEAPEGTENGQSKEKMLLITKARVLSVSEGEKNKGIEEYEELRVQNAGYFTRSLVISPKR